MTETDKESYLSYECSVSLAAHTARESEGTRFMRAHKLDQLCRCGGDINKAPSEMLPPSQWAINLFAGKILIALGVNVAPHSLHVQVGRSALSCDHRSAHRLEQNR